MIFKPGDLITFCNPDFFPDRKIPVYHDIDNFKDWIEENWAINNKQTFISIDEIGMVLELTDIILVMKEEFENAHKAIEYVDCKQEYLFYRVIVSDASIYYVYSNYVIGTKK